jgi:hypothetical protein
VPRIEGEIEERRLRQLISERPVGKVFYFHRSEDPADDAADLELLAWLFRRRETTVAFNAFDQKHGGGYVALDEAVEKIVRLRPNLTIYE